jgi:RimJ/RimL family protein N-acetyltransferase
VTLRIPARVETQRLVLRTWQSDDRAAFAMINADPAVTEHVARLPLSREQSDAFVDRIEASWLHRGYGLYAVESRMSGELVGFCGLSHHRALPDEVEVGWRLARAAWGRGLGPRRLWCAVISPSTRCAWTGLFPSRSRRTYGRRA